MCFFGSFDKIGCGHTQTLCFLKEILDTMYREKGYRTQKCKGGVEYFWYKTTPLPRELLVLGPTKEWPYSQWHKLTHALPVSQSMIFSNNFWWIGRNCRIVLFPGIDISKKYLHTIDIRFVPRNLFHCMHRYYAIKVMDITKNVCQVQKCDPRYTDHPLSFLHYTKYK